MAADKEKLLSLVAKAQSGDQAALNEIFEATYNDVYYFALKTVKDADKACDITQETFVTIFKNIHTLQEAAAFVSWSRQITYRQCLRHLRKNTDVLVDEDEDGYTIFDTLAEENEEFIPDQALDREDFRQTVMDIVHALPEEQRTAILLYYFDELSVKEIAEIQGVSEGTVKSRLNYGRKAIKEAVESYEKKHNLKLHSFGFFPFCLWLFGKDAVACSMAPAAAQSVAAGVAASTGTAVAAATAAKVGGIALWGKIVAGVAAAGVAAAGVAVAVSLTKAPAPQVYKGGGSIGQVVDGFVDDYEDAQYTITVESMDDTSISGTFTEFDYGNEETVSFMGEVIAEGSDDNGAYREYAITFDPPLSLETGLDLKYYTEKDFFYFWWIHSFNTCLYRVR